MSELVSEEVGNAFRLSRRTKMRPPGPNHIGPSQPLVEPVTPRLPKLRAFLWEMLMGRNATPPPAAASPLTAAPEPVAARAGAPSAAQARPTTEPPEPWAHWLAIRARLSPHEIAVVDMALGIVKPELQAEWLAGMSVLGVDQAVDLVRSMIPETPPEPPNAANNSSSDGGSCS